MTMYFKTLDPEYRPNSYWPESLFANIKGLVRRELLQQAVEEGNVDEIPPEAFGDSLSDESREAFSAIHPMHMGGEYLPDYLPEEIEIARICMKSTTWDVISIRALPTPDGKITYRVVDEYEELREWDYRYPHKVTDVPLTNAEIIQFVDSTRLPGDPSETAGASIIRDTWFRHIHDDIMSLEQIEGLQWIESELYPGLIEWHDIKEEEFLEEFVRPRIEELEEKERREQGEEGEEETGCCVSRWAPSHDKNDK